MNNYTSTLKLSLKYMKDTISEESQSLPSNTHVVIVIVIDHVCMCMCMYVCECVCAGYPCRVQIACSLPSLDPMHSPSVSLFIVRL